MKNGIIGILILIIVTLVLFLWKYQRQIKDICRQLSFLKKHDSNMMISREMNSAGIGWLVNELNEMLDRQKKERKRFREKEQMISDTYTNLSHDIRTPLTSLDGYFQLLENTKDPKEQERYIQIIQERIDSLGNMLEELFTFTKLKNESWKLKLEPCSITRILKDTILSYYDEWKRRGMEPYINIVGNPVFIQGNKEALKRVIQNIIKNGLDHGNGTFEIILKTEDQQVILQFRNEVLEPEQMNLDLIFERFYKADQARSKNSTGLGLPIAKEFTERMNGYILASLDGNYFQIELQFPILSC